MLYQTELPRKRAHRSGSPSPSLVSWTTTGSTKTVGALNHRVDAGGEYRGAAGALPTVKGGNEAPRHAPAAGRFSLLLW